MAQNKSLSSGEKLSSLKKLEELSKKTNLSDSDIRSAEELNESLGGMHSHLILAMQTRLELEKNGKNSSDLNPNDRMKSIDALLKDQEKYFENEKTKRTFNTIESIAEGKAPSDDSLCHMAASLSNNYDRKIRKDSIKTLADEALGIINRACDERRSLTPQEMEKLNKIREFKEKHEKAEHHSKSIDKIIGKAKNKEEFFEKVKEKKTEIISESRLIENSLKEKEVKNKELFELFGGLSNGLKDQSNEQATNKRIEGMRTVGKEMFKTEIHKSSDGRFTSFMKNTPVEHVDSSRSKSPDSTPGKGAGRNQGRV